MIYPVNNPTYKALLQESIQEFAKRNPKKIQALENFNRNNTALVRLRDKAIAVYESHLADLNMFDKHETKNMYRNALEALENFIKENLTNPKEITAVYDSILADVNPKQEAFIKLYNGKVSLYPSSTQAEEILNIKLKLDELEAKLERIKNEALKNGQTELNSKQLTRYNKTVREFNRVSNLHAEAVKNFRAMKALNQNIFEGIGLGDFYKQYTELSYIFNKKVPLPKGVSAQTFTLQNGEKRYIYRAYPFSNISPNGNEIIQIVDAPNTYLAVNGKNKRIYSLIEEKPNQKRKIYHFNEDGDVYKTAIFDPKTRKSKVIVNKKTQKN